MQPILKWRHLACSWKSFFFIFRTWNKSIHCCPAISLFISPVGSYGLYYMDYIICYIDPCFRFNEHIGRNIWPWHTFSVRMIEIKSSIWNENGLNQFYQLHKRSFLAVNRVVATFDWWTRDDFDFRKWKIRRFDAAFPIAISNSLLHYFLTF